METAEAVLEELDRLYASGNVGEIEHFLTKKLEVAREEGDIRTILALNPELCGLFRTTGREKQGVDLIAESLQIMEQEGLGDTLPYGITLLNGATVNCAAGNLEEAVNMCRRAELILENQEQGRAYLPALYNNMSQIFQKTGDYEEALRIHSRIEEAAGCLSGDAEATVRMNRALILMELGRMEEAEVWLKKAMAYYQGEKGQRDMHYSAALAALGQLYGRQGLYEKSLKCLEEALSAELDVHGESTGARVIRRNIDMVRKMGEGKGGNQNQYEGT